MVALYPCYEVRRAEPRRAPLELYRENGFIYRVAREEHGEAMARLLGDSFAHEPMSEALGLTAEENYEFICRYIPECTANGFSIIAVPEESPEELAGVILNRDFKAPLPAGLHEDFPRFAPVLDSLEKIDALYEAQVPGLARGQVLHMCMGGVDPTGRHARRGVTSNLILLSVLLARHHGFQRCLGECTNRWTQRCLLSAGFQEMARLDYEDYLFQGRRVFAPIAQHHVKVALYERVLEGGSSPSAHSGRAAS